MGIHFISIDIHASGACIVPPLFVCAPIRDCGGRMREKKFEFESNFESNFVFGMGAFG